MTNQPRAPSLLQARTNDHIHNHNHRHQHRYLHKHDSPRVRSNEKPNPRQLSDLESVVTEVVQTVSVIQIIDGAGSTISVETLYSDPITQLVDPSTGITLDSSLLDTVLPTLDVSGVASGDDIPASTALTATGSPAESTSGSTASVETPLTSAPSSHPGYPYLSSVSNSSTTHSPSIFSNSTLLRSLFANSTTSLSTSTATSGSSSSSESNTSTWLTSITESPTPTGANGDNGGIGTTAAGSSSVPTSSSASSTSSPGPPTSTVIEGVVGGVAGVTILVFVLLFLVKWKRRHDSGLRLLSDGNASRGFSVGDGSFSGPSAGGSGPMAERSLPFAIPATLASLTGNKRRSSHAPSAGTDSPERGFYRVSGKKLTSVLQSGGDGYVDPHDSMLSNTSFYRESQGSFGGPGAPRLQLGSPMRPDSGIPIMRSGPARTPVTEQGPLDAPRRLTPTPPSRDPINRSLASQDGSGVSASKFTENI